MLDPEFSIREDFPAVDPQQWRALVEKTPVVKSSEGIDQQPVYSRDDWPGEGDVSGFPGLPPFVRGACWPGSVSRGWDLRQEHSTPEPLAANQAILADLKGGVSSLLLVLDRAARAGFDPADERAKDLNGGGGLMAYQVDDLESALADVQLSMINVSLEAGAAFLPAAAQMAALWQRREHSSGEVRGAFNADPLGVLAREGHLPMSLETALAQVSKLARWTSEHYTNVTAVGVDSSPYHHAGATAAQDLAISVATAVQYLRSMTGDGMDIDSAAEQILFRMSLDTQHFLSIAKLRAGRRMWARVVEACDASPASAAMHVHARTSDRVLSRQDPQSNLLRNTVGVFAAGIGGAEAITSVPMDYPTGQTNEFSRRLARNTGLILQEESHLHRVIDPAGGSWHLEQLTDQIAENAWGIFQDIERQGGMVSALTSGWIGEQIAAASALREIDQGAKENQLSTSSDNPSSEEQQLRDSAAERIKQVRYASDAKLNLPSDGQDFAAAVDAAANGATLGQLADAFGFHRESTSIAPLETPRFADFGVSKV